MIAQRLFMGVAAIVFVLDVFWAAPGLTWLDGGEFVTTAGTMGVSHPPGQPAYMVLITLAMLLPVGELAFRITLLSAVCAAAAAGLLAIIVSRGTAKLAGLPGDVPLAGLAAGLLLGVSPALTMQAVRPELYALTLLLGLAAVAGILRGGRQGLALAVIPLCVAGAVHHAMLVGAIPGIALLAWGRGRGSLRAAIATTLVLLPFGLGQFAWLPLRSATLPPFDFGAPRTLERVIHGLTGAAYARSFRLDAAQLVRNVRQHLGVGLEDLGLLAIGVGLVGVAFLVGRRRIQALLAGAAFVVVGAAPTVLQGIFSPTNPDAHGYLLGPIAVGAAAAGLGLWALTEVVRRRSELAPWFAGALLLGVLAPPLLTSARQSDHRQVRTPRVLGAAILDQAPPGAIVLLGGDSWLFPALTARYHEQRRPDVHVFGLHMLEPQLLDDARIRGVPLPSVTLDGPAPEGLVAELVLGQLAGGVTRPLLANDFFLPPELLDRRRPAGLLHQFAGPLDPDPPTEADVAARIDEVLLGPPLLHDRFGQSVLARRHMARGGYHLQRGERDRALALYSRGSAITTDEWAMVHLARFKLETGAIKAGPWPLDDAVRTASQTLMAGDPAGATAAVDAVLKGFPIHPEALLLSERLYSLGHYADTSAAP